MTASGTIDLRRASSPSTDPTADAPDATRGPLHAERERAPRWMRVTGVVLLVAGVVLAGVVVGWPGSAPEVALVLPALLAVVVGQLLIVAQSGFDVTGDSIVLRFRPLPPVRIRRRQIAEVRLVEANVQTYGGVGLRIGRRSRALLLTPGLGIEITDARGRTWFVRTARPELAFRALADQRRTGNAA
jgi:hypothetical protein